MKNHHHCDSGDNGDYCDSGDSGDYCDSGDSSDHCDSGDSSDYSGDIYVLPPRAKSYHPAFVICSYIFSWGPENILSVSLQMLEKVCLYF